MTEKSQEGSQFCRGFGGIGGLLRYTVDFLSMEVDELDVSTTTCNACSQLMRAFS